AELVGYEDPGGVDREGACQLGARRLVRRRGLPVSVREEVREPERDAIDDDDPTAQIRPGDCCLLLDRRPPWLAIGLVARDAGSVVGVPGSRGRHHHGRRRSPQRHLRGVSALAGAGSPENERDHGSSVPCDVRSWSLSPRTMRSRRPRSMLAPMASATRSYSASLLHGAGAGPNSGRPFFPRSAATNRERSRSFSKSPWIIVPTTAPPAATAPSSARCSRLLRAQISNAAQPGSRASTVPM